MNTTPTDTKAKPTYGPYTAGFSAQKHRMVRNSGGLICTLLPPTHFHGQEERYEQELNEYKFHHDIINEALNVHHETGLTPRELVERYNEAIEALKEITSAVVSGKCRTESEVEKALIVINKATE